MAKKLIVRNPRNVPQGVRVLSFENQEWLEGDEFIKPRNMKNTSVDDLIAAGLLEVEGG